MSIQPVVDENYEQMREGFLSSPNEKEFEPFFSVSAVKSQLNFLLGDVLTIIDATNSDPVQRKALKDIVKQKFWDRNNYMADMFYGNGRWNEKSN